MKILLGADPEMFMYADGEPVSAHEMIAGSKENPNPVRNGATQVDGMALEFNIDPAIDEDDFVFKLVDVMQQMKDMVPDYEVKAEPVAYFGAEYIESQPEVAKELGCSPDFDAWRGGQENLPPDVSTPFRTGAGHVHIGWRGEGDVSPAHLNMCIGLVKQLDVYLGLASVISDTNTDRRALYGRAGAFRPKPYGVEYRVLSNDWLSSQEKMRMIYSNTVAALDNLIDGKALFVKYGDEIQRIINESDREAAIAILDKEGINYVV